MSDPISLDDSSYQQIEEKAMARLRRQAPWWTHTEVSDPGIMLMEMWAVLSDMQSFYLDQVQESHYRKYLKLLGIPVEEGEYAWTWIFFDQVDRERVIPRGTKLLADWVVFETETEVCLTTNAIKGIYLNNVMNRVDAMKRTRQTRFRLQEEGEILFSFTLKEALPPGRTTSFFVLLYEEGNEIKRNRAEKDFHMVELAWEYYEKGVWREAQVVRDDTGGLLYSGHVCLRIDMPMTECGPVRKYGSAMAYDFAMDQGFDMGEREKGYAIRCRIKEGVYDVMPSLYKICLNVVKVVQRNTLCCEETADFSENCHQVALKSYLARTGKLLILKKAEEKSAGGEELWEDITGDSEVVLDPPITADCPERWLSFAGEGHVKIVCIADGLEEFSGEVTGVVAQQIVLPWENLMRSSVKLMLKQEKGRKDFYCAASRIESEEERCGSAWHWKGEENVIVLGDGRHGEIPSPSGDGLRFLSLALWEGEKGNVAVDRINRWERPELFEPITCTNRLTGMGGRDCKLPSRQFEELRGKLFRQNRMVTEADIQELVLGTPGLMIAGARAYWEEGTMVVEVSPAHALKSPYCVEQYRNQVRKYLEQYRLAGTKLRIEVGQQ